MRLEALLQEEILAKYGAAPGLRIWRANTGVAFAKNGRAVRFGVKGSPDISGITRDGQRVEIEVKAPHGVLSPEQVAYRAMSLRFNALYILARSMEDVDVKLEKFL